jgi:hypothetical protein
MSSPPVEAAMRLRVAALSILLLSLLSGCSDDPRPSEGTEATGAPAAVAVAGSWVHTAFNGDFATTIAEDAEAFSEPRVLAAAVPEGAARAFFNVTVAGDLPDEVRVRLLANACDDQKCWEEGTTQGGQVSLDVDAPLAGDWQLILFAETAAQRGRYDVSVDSLVLASGA